jgi:hypothetical protein
VRLMPGIADWDGKAFPLQAPKGNLALSAPERLARVNPAVAWAGYALLGEKTSPRPQRAAVTRP